MQNHPIPRDLGAFLAAVSEAGRDLEEAQACIRAEEDSGRISRNEAAAERVGLLERHVHRLACLRAQYLGGE